MLPAVALTAGPVDCTSSVRQGGATKRGQHAASEVHLHAFILHPSSMLKLTAWGHMFPNA